MTQKDPYRRIAAFYDILLEPILGGLRRVGAGLTPPLKNKRVLDIGCGTGSFLARCARCGAATFGIDRSAAMLAKARKKIGAGAGLNFGDAARAPFREGVFDLIAVTMALHEMAPATRSAVIEEARRLLAAGGHLLVIDYHGGAVRLPGGQMFKLLEFCAELAAGGEHFLNYRHFMSSGGLAALIETHRLRVVRQAPAWQGTIVVSLLALTK
ncbi:MAG: class I SAM-dependent methyltransferase [Desulfobacterales bacterium]